MKDVWILSFECAGIAKVGGLGEAVYNMAKHLAERGLNVTLFTPSHGVHQKPETKKKLGLQESKLTIKGSLWEKSFLPYRSPFQYSIGVLKGFLNGFNVVIFYGLNKVTQKILDDEMVYRIGQIEDKALLLARGLSGYIENLKELKQHPPDIIHSHDYHALPAAVLAKQKLETRNQKTALVLTIHLLSEKKVSWNFLGESWCGIKNQIHPVYLYGKRVELSHEQLLKRAKFRLEAFGAMEAHVLTSVSQNYLNDEVLRRIGPGSEDKSAYHWNGCDWNSETMLKENIARFGDDIKKTLRVSEIRRYDLRKYFLTKAIGNLRPEEPILEEGRVKEIVNSLKDKPFRESGKVETFAEDGPMVLMTGRLAKQKGIDVLFSAIPHVVNQIPKAKFVLLLLPTEEEIDLIERFAKLTSKHSTSVRIVFGKAPSIYSLAHLASDIFVCPSKWEPFGIMALEAMATGNPVVATKVGGLKEIIIDANQDLENATGILVPKNDYKSLAENISSFLAITMISEILQKENKVDRKTVRETTGAMPNEVLKKAVVKQPSYGLKLRENAIRRVENTFRWSKVIDMTINAYEKAANIATLL